MYDKRGFGVVFRVSCAFGTLQEGFFGVKVGASIT